MKTTLKSIFVFVAGLFISKDSISSEININNRVLNIRKVLQSKNVNNKDSKIIAYYTFNNLKQIEENDLDKLDDTMQWRNNPNWMKNWNNYWNQVNWRNWNKTW
jgi:hypothetical protein